MRLVSATTQSACDGVANGNGSSPNVKRVEAGVKRPRRWPVHQLEVWRSAASPGSSNVLVMSPFPIAFEITNLPRSLCFQVLTQRVPHSSSPRSWRGPRRTSGPSRLPSGQSVHHAECRLASSFPCRTPPKCRPKSDGGLPPLEGQPDHTVWDQTSGKMKGDLSSWRQPTADDLVERAATVSVVPAGSSSRPVKPKASATSSMLTMQTRALPIISCSRPTE